MKNIFTLSLILFLTTTIYGQVYTDVLRISQLNPAATATAAGIGGALGAVGGDLSTLNINPAGLGEFRSSAFVITPSITSNNTTSYLNADIASKLDDGASKFGLDNLGVVFAYRPSGSNWLTNNIAISLNKQANYTQDFIYSGTTEGSITERFIELSNGKSLDELDNFEAGLAWDAGAIYEDDNGDYTSDFAPNQNVDKTQIVSRSGRLSELSLAWAGSMEKLSLGASLGIPLYSFEETKTYQESDDNDAIPIFNNLTYTEFVNTSGAGINVKLGVIYKPVKTTRIGASIQSPTWFSLDDNYFTSLEYDCTVCPSPENQRSPDGFFEYKATTPWRLTGSAAQVWQAGRLRGFVSADVEYVDYKSSSFNLTSDSNDSSDAFFEQELNDQIDLQFTSAINLRLGGEVGYDDVRFRLGYGLNGSPYDLDNGNADTKIMSTGIGLRQNKFFIDLGYQRTSHEEGYIPYNVLDMDRNQQVTNETDFSRFVLTLGFKF